MHPNAKNFRVRPCFVCDYEFSDEHHIHPEVLGRDKSPTIVLCPNHHRYAHILQTLVIGGASLEEITDFAEEHFDCDFQDLALEFLLSTYSELLATRGNKAAQILTKLQVGDFVIVHTRTY